MTPADEMRAAATRIRQLAEQGPYQYYEPRASVAVAALLEQEAAEYDAAGEQYREFVSGLSAEAAAAHIPALAVARAFLGGEQP